MRKENFVLAIVCIVAVISAHLLAGELHKRINTLSKGRDRVAQVPLAGFQKFTADIHWMLFLQFAGANPVNSSNVDKYYNRICRIIDLDPNFVDIYYQGALMLQPVDQKKALEILTKGIDHPEVGKNWKLPMLAGQIIMRKQWDRYYQDQPMDLEQVSQAYYFYSIAMKQHGRQGTALNSFIRVKAALETNGKSRVYNELNAWFEYWQDNRFNGDGFGFGGDGGGGNGRGSGRGGRGNNSADVDSGDVDYGPPFDVTGKIISLIRKGREQEPDDPDMNALIDRVRRRLFANVRFNPMTLEPIEPGSLQMRDGFIASPTVISYVLDLKAMNRYSILTGLFRLNEGRAKVTVLIDGVPVSGLEGIEIGKERVEVESLGTNVVGVDQILELRVDEATDAVGLAYALEHYNTSGAN